MEMLFGMNPIVIGVCPETVDESRGRNSLSVLG